MWGDGPQRERLHLPVGAVSPDLVAERVGLARAAFEAGRASADPIERLRWLDRAHRLLPADPTLTLALAEACLGRDDARAERLLRDLAAAYDLREVWFALAATRRALGDAAGAAEAMVRALSGHAMPLAFAPLADAVAAAAGAPGWCALMPDGTLAWGPAGIAPALRSDKAADRLDVLADGRPLLGSPLAPRAVRRVEGFVEAAPDGGLCGWAWQPANPDADPVLTLRPARGRSFTVAATETDTSEGGGLLARRRRFVVPRSALAGLAAPFRMLDADGRNLLGSPLDPAKARIAGATGKPPARGKIGRPAVGVDVIIPVHGGGAMALACIASVLASVAAPARVVVVDDASPEPGLACALDALAARRRIVLIRHRTARGFPIAANAGLRVADAARHDAVLLNSDTVVPRGWLDGLRAAAYGAPDIGTVTPLSNSGSIVSYPGPEGTNPVPDPAATRQLAALARRANSGCVVDIPVGVGFCLYVRHACLHATGRLRSDLFGQGYGEENDFCLRASARGWRHVAAPGVFVAHLGGRSFGAIGSGAAAALRARNAAILERRHPGYDALIAAYVAADPLAGPRRRIDALRWRGACASGAILLVTHDQGGGVERAIAGRVERAHAAGLRAILLRPARLPDGRIGARLVDAAAPGSHPNLVYAVPEELPELLAVLRADRIERLELHHLLGHAPEVLDLPRRLRVPYEVHVHDYALLCPRVTLVGAAGRYCGEPDIAGCEACVAAAGSLLDEAIGVAALRDRSARMLAGACRVVVPSADAAARIARYFPRIPTEVVAHEDDAALAAIPLAPARPAPCRVAVVGAISLAKGYDVLLACALDAAARALPLSFVVIGHTIDDARLLATGRAFVTGPYAPGEAEALIRAQECAIALLPSVWPETWCYALTEAWRAGLSIVAFDLGAPAERVRDIGCGVLLPLDAPAARINDVLLAGDRVSRQKGQDTKKQEQVHDARCCPGRPPSIRRQARPARPRSEPRDGASGVRPPDDA